MLDVCIVFMLAVGRISASQVLTGRQDATKKMQRLLLITMFSVKPADALASEKCSVS